MELYDSACAFYGQQVLILLTQAQDNQDFGQFVKLVDEIPNGDILCDIEDSIYSFDYGCQIPLVTILREIEIEAEDSIERLIIYKNNLAKRVNEFADQVLYMGYLLAKAILSIKKLQEYTKVSNEFQDDNVSFFLFIARAIKDVYCFTAANPELQSMLHLRAYWNGFIIHATPFLETRKFNLSAQPLIAHLSINNIEIIHEFLTTILINQTVNPKFFLEGPVRSDPKRDKYRRELSKSLIILDHIELKDAKAIIKKFEVDFLKSEDLAPNVVEHFLIKIKLLQRRYIEQSFQKLSDIESLIDYYMIYATRMSHIANGSPVTPAIREYYIEVTQFIAHLYYEITKKSIPPFNILRAEQIQKQAHKNRVVLLGELKTRVKLTI